MTNVDTTQQTVVAQPPPRLSFLDAIRGIAVAFVVVEHLLSIRYLKFSYFTSHYFEFGQFGVSLFFLCSGFVIPYTLERKPSLSYFWINRVFRLYPLYLAVLAFTLIVIGLEPSVEMAGTRRFWLILANTTMAQEWLGFPHIIGVSWTLGYELLFYIAMSALLVIKKNKSTQSIVLILMTVAIINPIVFRHVLHRPPHVGIVFYMATMFFGTLFFRVYQGAMDVRRLALLFTYALLVNVVTNYFAYDPHATKWDYAFWPTTTAWASAYIVFAIAYSLRYRAAPVWLCYIGTISYSVYFIHGFFLLALASTTMSLPTIGLYFIAVVATSSLTFYLIEKPMMKLGRRIAQAQLEHASMTLPPATSIAVGLT